MRAPVLPAARRALAATLKSPRGSAAVASPTAPSAPHLHPHPRPHPAARLRHTTMLLAQGIRHSAPARAAAPELAPKPAVLPALATKPGALPALAPETSPLPPLTPDAGPLPAPTAEAGALPAPTAEADALTSPTAEARALTPLTAEAAPTAEADAPSRADRVLAGLLAANAAFARGLGLPGACGAVARARLAAEGQAPTAAVIACADSRVAPELLFGAGLGELFVIRAAGNTAWGDAVLGSLEYAVDHLRVDVVLVLGHTQCGAVAAAVAGGDPPPGALGRHVVSIAKALDRRGGRCEDALEAVRRNVRCSVEFLERDSAGCVPRAAKERGLRVVGAVYDIASGEVSVLE